ncbi:hypothetical protein A7D25_23820 [Pseudomonas sp. 21C1]|nr:hypothetical protein A7D25_23820 [Pseudomonas sp. 21C1]
MVALVELVVVGQISWLKLLMVVFVLLRSRLVVLILVFVSLKFFRRFAMVTPFREGKWREILV